MNTRNPLPSTVSASLEARLAPFARASHHALEDLDVEASRSVAPASEPSLRLGASLKLLFAALGAGGSVVPLGDNGRTTRLLSEYAAALQRQ